MVAGKVKQAMGLRQNPPSSNPKPSKQPPSPSPSPSPTPTTKTSTKTTAFTRSFGAYFPRSSSQVQPKPPDISVSDLLNLVEQLRERESRLKTELVGEKLRRQSTAIVPILEAQIVEKDEEIEKLSKKVLESAAVVPVLEAEIVEKNEEIARLFQKVLEVEEENQRLKSEIERFSSAERLQGLIEVSAKSNLVKSFLTSRKMPFPAPAMETPSTASISSSDEIPEASRGSRVPTPPPPPTTKCTSSDSLTSCSSQSDGRKLNSTGSVSVSTAAPPPPPPPPPAKGRKAATATAKVKRVPEVVEFYHSFMRRDSRRDSGGGASTAEMMAASTRDLVGEIENRSAYLIAIKTDVETQGDLIRSLIKEVETAAFTEIEDVVSFVKWLDDELSYLVDERAVLKHFNWPEQKADALREAAFEYSDLKKLESEASSFKNDARQPCSSALKKMQTLLEKLEHGAYNLSRLRESATNRFKSFHIPFDWMLETGFVSQIKLASVKLAMKYMKRVLAELEAVCGGPEEEELIVQGVRFAFRVHQFAGGFDVETMSAFEELRDKARSGHTQCQNQQQQQPQRLACRSMPLDRKAAPEFA